MKKLADLLSWPFRVFPIPLSLFVFTTLLTGIGFYFSFRNIRKNYEVLKINIEETQQNLVDRLSREADARFNHYMSTVLNFTKSTSDMLQLTGLEGAYRFFLAQNTLSSYMLDNPEVVAINITDGLGRQLVDNQRTDVTAQHFESYIHKGTMLAFSGSDYMSPIIRVEGLKSPFVVFTRPVTDTGGTHVAAINLVISLDDLVDHMVAITPKFHTLFLCDDRGLLIAYSESQVGRNVTGRHLPGEDFSFHPLVKEFEQSGGRTRQVLSYSTGEGKFLGTFSPCRDLPWVIGSEIKADIAFSSIYRMQKDSRFWFITTLIVSILVAMVIAFAFRQPLRQLIEGSEQIAKHNFAAELDVRASNEFGQLADTYRLMQKSILAYLEQIKLANEREKDTFMRALQALVNAIDAKDPYTKGHSRRVSRYARLIAEEMGQSGETLEKTELSALLHDVGKIGIHDRILKKPAPLTEDEYAIMKEHPEKGMAILGTIDELREITDGMLYHHENWDGKGYPKGLKGIEIPLQARIVAVADAFDAMTTNRPYSIAMGPDQAVSRLTDLAGKRFDPQSVQALASAYYAGRLDDI